MEEKKTCCFTGHRPQSLPFRFDEQDRRCRKLKQVLRKEIERQIKEEGVTHFISGMAIGVDMYAAEIVLDLKKKYPQITLEAAIPCETQAVKWTVPLRERYYDIASRCDKETMLQRHYTPDCMHKRNHYKSARHIADRLKADLERTGPLSSYSPELFDRTVSSVTIDEHSQVQLVLKNGTIVGKEM